MAFPRLIPTALAVVLTGAAFASGIEDVEPRIERTVLNAALTQVPMDDDQRLISDMIYADYAVGLQHLAERAAERVEDAGRRRVEDALSGRIFLDPDELRRLRVAVARAQQQTWDDAEQLARGLLDDTRLGLDEETAAAYDIAARDVRRAMYLAPRRAREHDDTYAADGVDVIRLAEAATASGAELAGLDPDRLEASLDRYAEDIDRYLIETAAAARRSRTALAIARIERNDAARRTEERAIVDRWRAHYEHTRSAVEAVAAIARESLGAATETRWRERVDAASFPRLFAPRFPEKAHRWIVGRVNDAETLSGAEAVYNRFITRDRALRREAITTMLRGRLERSTMVHPRMDPASISEPAVRDMYQSLLKNSGRRSAAAAEAKGELEALLTERQRKQMNADIAASAYGRRRR